MAEASKPSLLFCFGLSLCVLLPLAAGCDHTEEGYALISTRDPPHCYYAGIGRTTLLTAHAQCQQLGGHVVWPESLTEQDFLLRTLQEPLVNGTKRHRIRRFPDQFERPQLPHPPPPPPTTTATTTTTSTTTISPSTSSAAASPQEVKNDSSLPLSSPVDDQSSTSSPPPATEHGDDLNTSSKPSTPSPTASSSSPASPALLSNSAEVSTTPETFTCDPVDLERGRYVRVHETVDDDVTILSLHLRRSKIGCGLACQKRRHCQIFVVDDVMKSCALYGKMATPGSGGQMLCSGSDAACKAYVKIC